MSSVPQRTFGTYPAEFHLSSFGVPTAHFILKFSHSAASSLEDLAGPDREWIREWVLEKLRCCVNARRFNPSEGFYLKKRSSPNGPHIVHVSTWIVHKLLNNCPLQVKFQEEDWG
jgi:hypothetical protein